MSKHLSSPNNPLIKHAVLLKNKAQERKSAGMFLAEGFREVALALRNGFQAEHLFFDPGLTPQSAVEEVLAGAAISPKEIITVTGQVLEKIAYRASVPNVVGIFHQKQTAGTWAPTPGRAPLVLVLEGIEKPGNLGAILRTADAANADAVFVCEPGFDLFNPNAVRASLGAIFTLPIFEMPSTEAARLLKNHHVRILATYLEAARSIYDADLAQPVALVLGAEASGISPFWMQEADERIIIPMAGQVDSMNVSASAAIVLFEAVRQRTL